MEQMWNEIQPWIQVLLPILIVQILLLVIALIDLTRREQVNGPKWVWALVIVFVNLFGPILYFIFGRNRANGR
ncbi:hypothetical protein JCM19046_1534 [Bacillus sp. JCM 19046]|uniref:Cardiolipin synthase N-terminal domain-containing protein n=1 Tax=Shouchella xiaoxiensis TaxID=766895 RepID=A0ABS2SSB0_9BACI|nr:PLD nuclease N-terminal domain-containing protein [Shouchella xiaoxiensis]MBM7837399.1 hypothetical protein [Shouchella xiaoxiensis]GAF13259.1 hypothetical protein JCM19045_2496 [Bacillus sp. JCM 19045]GAF17057.1 hypothetical protein JCM19046_1534 [Bacillus sp. JCM 19046]